MNRPPGSIGLRRNFLWILSGNLIYGLCQWGLIALIARLSSPQLVGQFAFGLAVTAPVYMFTNLQLRAVQATDAAGRFGFADYLGVRLTATAAGFVAIAAYVAIAEDPRSPRGQVILWLAAAKAFEAVSDLLAGLPQQHERGDLIALPLIVKGLVSLVVVGAVLQLSGSLVLASAGLAGVWLLLLVGLDLPICRRVARHVVEHGRSIVLRPRLVGATLIGVVALGAPLGIARLLMSLQTSIPRYVVDHFGGERALGIFAALAYLIVIGNRFMHSLGQSVAPRLARHHIGAEGAAFRRLYLRMLAVGAAFGAAGVALAWGAGSWILGQLYGAEYAAHRQAFLWIMVAAGLGYLRIFMDYAMIATRWIRIQVPLLGLSTLVLTVAALYWVPRMGILGGAVALVVAAAVHLAGSLVVNLMILRSLPAEPES